MKDSLFKSTRIQCNDSRYFIWIVQTDNGKIRLFISDLVTRRRGVRTQQSKLRLQTRCRNAPDSNRGCHHTPALPRRCTHSASWGCHHQELDYDDDNDLLEHLAGQVAAQQSGSPSNCLHRAGHSPQKAFSWQSASQDPCLKFMKAISN